MHRVKHRIKRKEKRFKIKSTQASLRDGFLTLSLPFGLYLTSLTMLLEFAYRITLTVKQAETATTLYTCKPRFYPSLL